MARWGTLRVWRAGGFCSREVAALLQVVATSELHRKRAAFSDLTQELSAWSSGSQIDRHRDLRLRAAPGC